MLLSVEAGALEDRVVSKFEVAIGREKSRVDLMDITIGHDSLGT